MRSTEIATGSRQGSEHSAGSSPSSAQWVPRRHSQPGRRHPKSATRGGRRDHGANERGDLKLAPAVAAPNRTHHQYNLDRGRSAPVLTDSVGKIFHPSEAIIEASGWRTAKSSVWARASARNSSSNASRRARSSSALASTSVLDRPLASGSRTA